MRKQFRVIADCLVLLALVGSFFVLVYLPAKNSIAQQEGGLEPSEIQAQESPKAPEMENRTKTESQDITVYRTRTGSKYHRAGCQYLAKGSIPISLKDAAAKGLGPCSRCNPPKLPGTLKGSEAKSSSISPSSKNSPPAVTKEIVVYVTRTGTKYHRAGCRYLARSSIPMSLKEAAARYSPCSVCRPPVVE